MKRAPPLSGLSTLTSPPMNRVHAGDRAPRDVQRDGAVTGELRGVAQQVEENLPRFREVGVDRAEAAIAERDGQRVAVLADHGVDRADQLVDHLLHVERLEMQLHLAGFDLREIEDAVDQPEQMLARGLNFRQVRDILLTIFRDRAFLQQLAVKHDGVERGAQLVAHVGDELALRAGRGFHLLLAETQSLHQFAQLDRLSQLVLMCPFEDRRAIGNLIQLARAADALHHQEHIFEPDPGRMFEPAPLARHEHAVDRLRPEDAAQQVIERDHDGGRDEDAPVAIKRQERQRAEHVEMRFDAAAGQEDEQRAHQHLRGGDNVACGEQARTKICEQRGKHADGAAEEHRRPDVDVRLARRAVPGERRDP